MRMGFFGHFATSYYYEVLASQGCPPRIPIICKVIAGPDGSFVSSSEKDTWEALSDPLAQNQMLKDLSDTLEKRCVSSGKQTGYEYNGGMLIPN